MCLVQVGYFVAVMSLLGGTHSAPEYVQCNQLCNVIINDIPEVEPESACVVEFNDTYGVNQCVDALAEISKSLRISLPDFLEKVKDNLTFGEESINKTTRYLGHLNAALKEKLNRKFITNTYCVTKRLTMKLTLLMRLLKQKGELPSEAWGTTNNDERRNSNKILFLLRNMKMDAINSIKCNDSKIDKVKWVKKLHDIKIYDTLMQIEVQYLKKQNIIRVLRRVVEPVLSAGMFIIGAFFNILMLSIFVRCPQSRAPRNMILLQLAVSDMLSLTVNLPVYHTLVLLDLFPGKRPQERFFEFVRYMCFSIGIFSIVALCFQRYCATLKLTDRGMILRQSTKYSSILVIGTVWLCAITISVYHAFLCIHRDCFKDLGSKAHVHGLSYIVDFLFLALAPFLLIWILSALTVRHFQKRLAQLKISLPPEAWEKLRLSLTRSTTVLRLTPLVFAVSFIPIYLLHVTVVFGVSINSIWYNCFFVPAYAFIFLQTWFNPIATYMTSSTFRGYLHSYIFRKRYDQIYSFDLQPEKLKEHNSLPEELELQRFKSQNSQE